MTDNRRDGDIATCYAKVDNSNQQLNWKAENNLEQMCLDAWRYQKTQIK